MIKIIFTEKFLEKLNSFPENFRENIEKLAYKKIQILKIFPYIGESLDENIRKLVFKYGKSSYLIAYTYLKEDDICLILTIKHCKEKKIDL